MTQKMALYNNHRMPSLYRHLSNIRMSDMLPLLHKHHPVPGAQPGRHTVQVRVDEHSGKKVLRRQYNHAD